MKQKILDKLKALQEGKFQSLSTKTLDVIVGVLETQVKEESEIDTVIQANMPILETFQGQLNHDLAEAAKNNQKPTEQKPVEQKPVEQKPTEQKPTTDMEAIKAMMAELIAPVTEKLNGYEKAKTTETIIGEAKKQINTNYEFQAENQARDKVLDLVLKSNPNPEKAEDIVNSFKDTYDVLSDTLGGSALPINPSVSHGGGARGRSLKDRKMAEGKIPAKD